MSIIPVFQAGIEGWLRTLFYKI